MYAVFVRIRRAGWRLSGLLLALALAGCGNFRPYESALVLADMNAGAQPSRLKHVTASPTRTETRFAVAGRDHAGDLYLPGAGRPRAAIVLVPGAVPEGRSEPRLVAFATTLARADFAVLVPELEGFRRLAIHPDDSRVVADAFAWLAAQDAYAPQGRAGIGAFSYAVGPALLAALEDDVRERVRFVLSVGGYHDLARAMRFVTTGHFETAAGGATLTPSPYGRLVLVSAGKAYLDDAADRALFDAMVARRRADRDADLADLAARLGPQGQALYRLASNTDPARFPALYAALPERMRADIAALSPVGRDLTRLRARLILVHGRDDSLIPYPESEALARAAEASRTRLFLIDEILGHADFSLSHLLTWRFLSRELPNVWRMGRAVNVLLRERNRDD